MVLVQVLYITHNITNKTKRIHGTHEKPKWDLETWCLLFE